jgi:hypothetical protein
MMLNATFNNISVIKWWSVLLVEESGQPELYCLKTVNCNQEQSTFPLILSVNYQINLLNIQKSFDIQENLFKMF